MRSEVDISNNAALETALASSLHTVRFRRLKVLQAGVAHLPGGPAAVACGAAPGRRRGKVPDAGRGQPDRHGRCARPHHWGVRLRRAGRGLTFFLFMTFLFMFKSPCAKLLIRSSWGDIIIMPEAPKIGACSFLLCP